MNRRSCFAWLPGLRGVDQTETRHSVASPSPHRMTPHRCPDRVGVTSHPALSASRKAPSTSFFGCLVRAMLTRYNTLASPVEQRALRPRDRTSQRSTRRTLVRCSPVLWHGTNREWGIVGIAEGRRGFFGGGIGHAPMPSRRGGMRWLVWREMRLGGMTFGKLR